MPVIAVYLIFAAVLWRVVVVLSVKSEFPAVLTFLAGYGALLFGKTWLADRRQLPRRKCRCWLDSTPAHVQWRIRGCVPGFQRQLKPNFAAGWQDCYWGRNWHVKYMGSWMMQNEPLEVMLLVTAVLEKLGSQI